MGIYPWINRTRRLLKQSALVLMYHKIDECITDPWMLSVNQRNFEAQLQILKKTGLVRPISQLIDQIYFAKTIKPCIVVTFDDGYADNYWNAKPLLEKYEVPATFFISNKHIGQEKEFWWDELAYILLHVEQLPPSLSFCMKDTTFSFNLSEEVVLTDAIALKHNLWNAYLKPSTLRTQLYMQLWQLFTPLSYQEQQFLLGVLRNWAGITEKPRRNYISMSKDQLLMFAKEDLWTIGAHTVSHPSLPYHPENIQHLEISNNKLFLETQTGLDINAFAYPSGQYNNITINLLKQLGFRIAFTTKHQLLYKQVDPYQIGRFQVNNWMGQKFMQILSKWY